MNAYDAYLFDWDGTLANSHDMWLEIMHGQLRRHGIHVSDEQVVRQLFGRYDEGMRELGFSMQALQALSEELETAAKRSFPLVDLFPGAQQVLEALKRQGKKVALVTASYREVIDVAVAKHNILELFAVTVSGDEMNAPKPDPGGLLLALQTMGVPPTRAIMIGDSPKDLLAGKNAGTDTLLFYPPEHASQHSLAELKKCRPTYTIRSWQELLDQLQ
jgi:pyrophosphatase PpaX